MDPAAPLLLTTHSIERAKERCGWNEKTLARMARKALEHGVSQSQATGDLRAYLDGRRRRAQREDRTRVYGEHVYVVEGNRVITILRLPKDLRPKPSPKKRTRTHC